MIPGVFVALSGVEMAVVVIDIDVVDTVFTVKLIDI